MENGAPNTHWTCKCETRHVIGVEDKCERCGDTRPQVFNREVDRSLGEVGEKDADRERVARIMLGK